MKRREIYMVHCNCGGSVFVKTLDFFQSQGGFRNDWGVVWVPVMATSIEDARRRGCEIFPDARPFEEQAKEW